MYQLILWVILGGEIYAYIFHSTHPLPWKWIIIEQWPLSKKWRSRGERKKKKKTDRRVFLYIIYYRLGRLPSSVGRWILRNKDGNCMLYFLRRIYHAWYHLPCRKTIRRGECLTLTIHESTFVLVTRLQSCIFCCLRLKNLFHVANYTSESKYLL